MEDELRREYDLKSLQVRRLGAARKSFGKLSRDQVFLLKRDQKNDKLELPTDISGIISTSYDSGNNWRDKLV